MNDSEYEEKMSSRKKELEDGIQKLEQLIFELNGLAQKCSVLIANAKQNLNIFELQVSTIQKTGRENSKDSATKKQSTILIVEDEFNIRELLRDFVSSRGCTTVTAEDGYEAIVAIQKQYFDMVFLDLKLPRISGVEVLKKIKEISPSTPVVVVSGNADELHAIRERSFRPQWVIPKPFKLQQIGEALNMIGSR